MDDDLDLLDDARVSISKHGHVVVEASPPTLRALMSLHANTTARMVAGSMQRPNSVQACNMRMDTQRPMRWCTYMNWTYEQAH